MNKIVIGLTVRGKDADKFWFSLFHELGHILLGHINKPEELNEEDEKAADTFARDVLIPESDFTAFTDRKQFTHESIVAFAKKVTIDTGIVVGRLQKENHVSFNMFNDMKQRYSLAE